MKDPCIYFTWLYCSLYNHSFLGLWLFLILNFFSHPFPTFKRLCVSLSLLLCLIQIPLRSENLLCFLSTVVALNTGPCTWNCSPWINNLGAHDHPPFFPSVPIFFSNFHFLLLVPFFWEEWVDLSWQHHLSTGFMAASLKYCYSLNIKEKGNQKRTAFLICL